MAGIDYFDSLIDTSNPAARNSRSGFGDAQYGLGAAGARSRFGFTNADIQRRFAALQRQYGQQVGDLERSFERSKEPMVSSFAQRGLGRSGIFNKAMQEYLTDRQRSLGDLTAGFAEQQGALELERLGASQNLQSELDWLALQKQQQVMNDAAELRRWAPMTGLFG